jgi:transcription elongation GreA/GreB family factor
MTELGRGDRLVAVGSWVRIFDGYGEFEFVLTPGDDARAGDNAQVSAEGPLGRALIGRRVGEEVIVRTRTGLHFVRIRQVGVVTS